MAKAKPKAEAETGGIGMGVHLLLDRSGSMTPRRLSVIRATNEFVRRMAMAITPSTFTITQFNEHAKDILVEAPVYDVPQITGEQYKIYGGTVIGRTILRAITALAKQPVQQRTIVLLTDGEDGATTPGLQAAMEKRRAEGWLILYIGVGQDKNMALYWSAQLGFPPENVLHCGNTPASVEAAMEKAANAVLNFRAFGGTEADFKNVPA
jgi:hypothetical protein